MKDVQRALEDSDLGHALELLDRYRPQGKFEVDLRGWEWRYLWARCRSDEHFTLCRYSDWVTALAFSPDGKWLAVRQGNGAVALWDAVAKRAVAEMRGGGYYKALAFAPRGRLLAWGNEDPIGQPVVSVRNLDARTSTAHFALSDKLVSVAFSPDAKVMATLAHDGAVKVWDVESQTVLTNFATAMVNVRAELFSAAAEVKATSTATQTLARREAESQPVQPRNSQFDAFFGSHYGCVLFSPDGQWLAVGEGKPRLRLLDRITGIETVLPVPAAGGITALAFSPDSKRLAAGCGFENHQVFVWDLAVGAAARLAGHSGCIVGLAFSPDGQTLASVSTDQTLRLWDVARTVERRRFQGHRDEVWAVARSPDGHDLVTGSKDGSVRYWDPAADPAPSYAVLDERAWFWGPVFFPDSQSLLTVTRPRGAVVRWSVEREANTWRRVGELPWLGTNHTSVDLSRDGRWLALGDRDGNIQVWDYPGHRFVTNLVSPGRWIFGLMFSPSGHILHCATSHLNPLAPKPNPLAPKLYAVDGWRELDLRGVNLDNLFEADLSPDERTLAIAYKDGTVAWWDLATGQRQTLFHFHDADRIHVAFSADARIFAAGSLDGQITVWDVATRRVRPIAHGHHSVLTDLALSPDRRRLVASGTSTNDLIKIWDVETGREMATLPGEPGLFIHIGFSPDGNTLFATSFEGIALLWRVPSWEAIEAVEKWQGAP
jgi:WD40 repeat protein